MRTRLLLLGLLILAVPSRVWAGDAAAVGSGTVDVLVVDEKDRPLEGAVVWALGTKLETPVPTEPVVLSQKGLEFRPRFLVARRGQTLVVTNDDPEAHNVHSSDACCSVNFMVPVGGKKEKLLDQAGEVTFLCDIHAHMRGTLLVLEAIHARTDATGHARLELPAGKRKLRARALDRERGEVEVELAVGKQAETKIVLAPPPKGPQVVAPEKLPWPALAAHLREGLDDAVRLARAGKGDEARAAAEEAVGRWFANDLYTAIQDAKGRAAATELKSDVRGLFARMSAAAEKGGAALAELEKEVERVCDSVLTIARELPKR